MSDTSPALEIITETTDNATVIRLCGSADMSQCSTLSARIDSVLSTNAGDLVIDMTQLRFICSIGLSSILTAYTETIRNGSTFRISGASPAIQSVLEVTHLDRLLESGETAE